MRQIRFYLWILSRYARKSRNEKGLCRYSSGMSVCPTEFQKNESPKYRSTVKGREILAFPLAESSHQLAQERERETEQFWQLDEEEEEENEGEWLPRCRFPISPLFAPKGRVRSLRSDRSSSLPPSHAEM